MRCQQDRLMHMRCVVTTIQHADLFSRAFLQGVEDNAQPVKFLKLGAALDERVWYDDKYYWEVPSEAKASVHTINVADATDNDGGAGDKKQSAVYPVVE